MFTATINSQKKLPGNESNKIFLIKKCNELPSSYLKRKLLKTLKSFIRISVYLKFFEFFQTSCKRPDF